MVKFKFSEQRQDVLIYPPILKDITDNIKTGQFQQPFSLLEFLDVIKKKAFW